MVAERRAPFHIVILGPTAETQQQCREALAPCDNAGEQCKFLACIDATLGNFSDGRIRMVGK